MKGKNKKIIALIAGVVALVVLSFVLKYMVLLPLVIVLLIVVTVLINRKILKMRKKGGESTEEQRSLSDAAVKKFAGYFVNQDEKYLSSLGNGYIMSYFANGSLSRGFAVISDKRVYFRGACFTGRGKTLKMSDEERTVDIRDVTGSGFIYQRYLGVLIGLFTALAVLLGGIAGSVALSGLTFGNFSYAQDAEKRYKAQLDDVEDLIKQSGQLETDIENAAKELDALEKKLDELNEKQSEEVMQYLVDNVNFGDVESVLYGSELDVAYQQYLTRLLDIVTNESSLCDAIERLNWIAERYGSASTDYSFQRWTTEIERVTGSGLGYIGNHAYIGNGDLYYAMRDWGNFEETCLQNYNYEADRLIVAGDINTASACLQILGLSGSAKLSVEEFLGAWCGISDYILWLSYQCQWLDEYPDNIDELYYLYYMGPYDDFGDINSLDSRWHYGDHIVRFCDPLRDAFDEAYEEFKEQAVPRLSDSASVEEMMVAYLKLHPDASYGQYLGDVATVAISYDEEIVKVNAQIERKQQDMESLRQRQQEAEEAVKNEEKYRQRYESHRDDTFINFAEVIGSCSLIALLLTFTISCFMALLDYLRKRKTFFEIQYAGGRIAFDVSYYAKAEIEDFQKQLRRAKDLVLEQVQVVERAAAAPAAETAQVQSVPDDLRKYAELLKDGLITQEEYDAMKKKILNL